MLKTGFILLALLVILSPVLEGIVNAQTDITLPTYQGYISVAPGGRYFVDETGKGFLVIGQNDGTPWPGLAILLNGASPEATGTTFPPGPDEPAQP